MCYYYPGKNITIVERSLSPSVCQIATEHYIKCVLSTKLLSHWTKEIKLLIITMSSLQREYRKHFKLTFISASLRPFAAMRRALLGAHAPQFGNHCIIVSYSALV